MSKLLQATAKCSAKSKAKVTTKPTETEQGEDAKPTETEPGEDVPTESVQPKADGKNKTRVPAARSTRAKAQAKAKVACAAKAKAKAKVKSSHTKEKKASEKKKTEEDLLLKKAHSATWQPHVARLGHCLFLVTWRLRVTCVYYIDAGQHEDMLHVALVNGGVPPGLLWSST